MASKNISFLFLISLLFAGGATASLAGRRLLGTPAVVLPPLPSIPPLPKHVFPPLPHVWDFPKPEAIPPAIAGVAFPPEPFPFWLSAWPPLPKVPSFTKPEVAPPTKAIPPAIAGVPAFPPIPAKPLISPSAVPAFPPVRIDELE